MSFKEILTQIQEGLVDQSFDGTMKFDCGEDGVIVLADGTATDVDQETDCTVKVSTENLAKVLNGELNPMAALALGKAKLSGDATVAMKMGSLLG